MTSGFGWGGGRSRCFAYWQEFQKCYIQTDNPIECRPASNDYLECLHHTKEIKRAQAIQAEFHRRQEHEHDADKKHGQSAPPPPPASVAPTEKTEGDK